ncbi:MAG: aminoglycoside phosphotransferase family protein [Caldilineaceae bacterium]
MKIPSEPVLYAIAQDFAHQAELVAVDAYGAGNVNDTYLVTLVAPAAHIGSDRFVLQRVNTHVFRRPELILKNMRTFLGHMEARLQRNGEVANGQGLERWHMPRVIATQAGLDAHVDGQQSFWRAITLVEGAKTYAQIQDAAHAREAGYALGRFHSLLSDLDPAQLHDTLPGFHITPQYLAHYDEILTGTTAHERQRGAQRSAVADAMRFIDERRVWATVLEDAVARCELIMRSIHGDPKVDNILIDNSSNRAVSIIDLDTVKPGLVHYDIGDCLRSCCNPAGEETMVLDDVTFDMKLCRAILAGYLAQVVDFFTEADYAYIYDSIRLITFELGLRFFSDYLAGDVYFKTRYPEHNLQRALVQFRLAASIEAQEREIRQLVAEQ